MSKETRVAIVGGCRTPFVKAMGVMKNKTADDLSVAVVKRSFRAYRSRR